MQYKTNVQWDSALTDLELIQSDANTRKVGIAGLVYRATKMTTGAPATTAGVFIPGAIIQNAVSGVNYQNTGSTASPVWSVMENSTSDFTLPVSETDSATTTTTSFAMAMTALTTGIAQSITAILTTTGKIYRAVADAATLTTGRYFEANDGATNVWGIGANGHTHYTQTTAPTIAVSTANGISAAAITAGGTDVVGAITTTGTNNAGGNTVLQVTFNKTYTTAPKAVFLMPLNAAAAKAAATSLATPFISAIAATTFDITIPSDASAGATPSWSYLVIA
jgi:hypothetical protein